MPEPRDDLPLPWEGEPDDPPAGRARKVGWYRRRAGMPAGHRPDRTSPTPPEERGRRARLALSIAAVLLVVLGGIGYVVVRGVRNIWGTPDYGSSTGTGSVVVEIRAGDTATDIGDTLQHADVVKSTAAFVNAAKADPHSREIEVGLYRLPHHISGRAALRALLARDAHGVLVNRITNQVTIPEGMISVDVYRKLSGLTKIPVADFTAAARNPAGLGIPAWWLTRTDGKKMLRPPSIEGFLYPDTYELPPHPTAAGLLRMMVDRFLTVTGDLRFADNVQATLHITPYEALVAASIAQVEAKYDADMPGVARVLYNRAYSGSFPCGCLGLDSEVNYWLRITGQKAQPSGALRDHQLHDPSDPYNTHDRPGLPVGPISNPGRAALSGAMDPPKNTDLYFLGVDAEGHTAFARSYRDFCKLVREAAANGVSIGSC